jgi:hypothetical protein
MNGVRIAKTTIECGDINGCNKKGYINSLMQPTGTESKWITSIGLLECHQGPSPFLCVT